MIRGASFGVAPGEVVGLIGESGCGKSVAALATVGLLPPAGRICSGSIRFDGLDLTRLSEKELRPLRGGRIGFVFQEPGASLNPVLTVGGQITETLRAHRPFSRAEAEAKALELCERLALPEARLRFRRPAFELSGGQRQRVMLALALAADPDLLIADEPTTALDPGLQAQVLGLLLEQRRARGLAILLITHDLAVASAVCDRIVVLYAGEVVEEGPIRAILDSPLHPYTQGLLRAAQDRSPGHREGGDGRLSAIPGQVPAFQDLPPGCAFQPRCERRLPACSEARVDLVTLGGARQARCLLVDSGSSLP